MKRLLVPLLPLLVALAQPVHAQTGDCDFGLVLSGGGARGVAHLGVLEVLEAAGIRPDCIAGASMGSVVGSLYATGHSIEQIRELLDGLSWRNLYVDSHNRRLQPILHRLERQRTAVRLGFGSGGIRTPQGILSDTMVNRLLIQHLAPANFAAGRDFGQLPIAFRTVGTDLRTGDRIVLSSGDLARAVRSSMSVPLAYAPVPWNEALLVDGGLVDNVPVSLAKEMGARFTVAVEVSTPLNEEVVPDLLGVTQRIVDLLFVAKNSQYATPPDVLIRPDLADHSFANYSGFARLIEAGRAAAEAALEQIPARYRGRALAARAPTDPHVFGPRTIESIGITGRRYLADRVILREFRARVGQPFDWDRVLADLDHLYASGLLQSAWLDLEPTGDDSINLLLHVQEEYRHTADIGLAYQTDDQVQGFLRLETRDLLGSGERLQVSGFASQKDVIVGVRLQGEAIFGAHVGYQIDIESHEERPKVFVDGESIARAEFDREHLQLGANLPFGMNHALQVGFRMGGVETIERLGVPYPGEDRRHRILVGRYVWDNLSSLSLPGQGQHVTALVEHDLAGLGATGSYFRLEFTGRAIRRLGPVVVEGRALYGYSSGELPVYEQFRVGGPELVPGLAREEIWGNQAVALSGLLGHDPFSILRLYVRVGTGGVWERTGDIDGADLIFGGGLGVTLATPIGPIQVDYGWAGGGRNRFYFSIGWQ